MVNGSSYPPDGKRSWLEREGLIVAALTVLALLLRIYHLGRKPLNGGDEPYTFALSQHPFGEMFELFRFEANGTLYSVLLWPLAQLGESEELIRTPALIFGVLAVPAVWWAGRELGVRRAGLIAAALMAVSPIAVFYSQYGRPFSMLICLASVTFASLALALRTGERRWWAAHVVALAATGYANALAPIGLVCAQGAWIAYERREDLRRYLASVGVALLLCVPLIAGLLIARSRRDPLFWLEAPGLGSLYNLAGQVASGFRIWLPAFALVALVVAAVALGVLLRGGLRPDGKIGNLLGVPPVLWAWALVPIAVPFLIAQVEPVFWPAYVMGTLPGILLVISVLLTRLSRRFLAGALASLLALGLLATGVQANRDIDETWRSTLTWIDREWRDGDKLLVDSISTFPVISYYLPQYRAPNGELIVDEWDEYPLPDDIVPFDAPGGYTGPPGPPTPEDIARNASGDRRLFVVYSEYVEHLQGDIPNGEAITWARANCKVIERDEYAIDAFLISGCPPSP